MNSPFGFGDIGEAARMAVAPEQEITRRLIMILSSEGFGELVSAQVTADKKGVDAGQFTADQCITHLGAETFVGLEAGAHIRSAIVDQIRVVLDSPFLIRRKARIVLDYYD